MKSKKTSKLQIVKASYDLGKSSGICFGFLFGYVAGIVTGFNLKFIKNKIIHYYS